MRSTKITGPDIYYNAVLIDNIYRQLHMLYMSDIKHQLRNQVLKFLMKKLENISPFEINEDEYEDNTAYFWTLSDISKAHDFFNLLSYIVDEFDPPIMREFINIYL